MFAVVMVIVGWWKEKSVTGLYQRRYNTKEPVCVDKPRLTEALAMWVSTVATTVLIIQNKKTYSNA